ncbi:hypothetical protein FB567DRAFT_220188 [Paraphoma chrysanthemicola]|uniref:Uncharacterized protein n=1 Tax=Paraphoma chrysanthemicola TaxID=798071 RepID=A0A8K0QTC3_9PLEO|nr:hypothetical protein FB567DRAFT_220188 [Paraphoma chrysanthemicola]
MSPPQCIQIVGKGSILKKQYQKFRRASSNTHTISRDKRCDQLAAESKPLIDAPRKANKASARKRRSWRHRLARSNQIIPFSATRAWWCLPFSRLLSSQMAIIMLFMLFSLSTATPIQVPHLDQRQSIPDRFGNTGNQPAPVVSPPSIPTNETPTTSTTAILQLSSTLVSAPVTSTTSFNEGITSTRILDKTQTASSPRDTMSSSTVASTLPTSLTAQPTPGVGNQLQRTEPQNPLSPSSIIGIALGAIIFLIIMFGIIFLLYRRKKARQVDEIPIRYSKLGGRSNFQVVGSDNGAYKGNNSKAGSPVATYTEDLSSSQQFSRSVPEKHNTPLISPSVYSPRLKRARRISTMTFGSVSGWLDKSIISRPQPVFTGTPSQLLDAPRPLFARDGGGRMAIIPPMPARPTSAEPLGRLSGMGYGLGMRGGELGKRVS